MSFDGEDAFNNLTDRLASEIESRCRWEGRATEAEARLRRAEDDLKIAKSGLEQRACDVARLKGEIRLLRPEPAPAMLHDKRLLTATAEAPGTPEITSVIATPGAAGAAPNLTDDIPF